jgi:hypothetical protein
MKRSITTITLCAALLLGVLACNTDDSIRSLSDQTLLAELLKVDQQRLEALSKGDSAALEKILADEYSVSGNGSTYGDKKQALAAKGTGVNYPPPENPKLSNRSDDSAEIEYEQTARDDRGSTSYQQRAIVKVKFVKRDRRFQIVSADVTLSNE